MPLSFTESIKRVTTAKPFPVAFGRDAFVYLEPRRGEGESFAQCGSCKMFLSRQRICSLHGKGLKVDADDSCGLYCPGGPAPASELEHVKATFTPQESGFVRREVRCENCRYFDTDSSDCELFASLGLKQAVRPHACCNANSPR